jgi:hypothetical protein
MEPATVFRTFNGPEAHLVRSRLEAAGIHATVLHENAALAVAGAGVPAVEIRLVVGAESAEDARALIAAARDDA